MKKLSLLLLSLMSIFFLSAQLPGTLYQNFGDNGIVLTDFVLSGDDDNLSQVAVLQDDNKIILGGRTTMNGMSNLMLVRYNPHGTLDQGFGSSGIKVLPFGGSHDFLSDVAVQEDGKIVAVGYTIMNDETQMLALRLNSDGSFDDTFSGNGMNVISFGDSINCWAQSMAVLDDGKILITGFIQNSPFTYAHIAMCKLTAAGGMDYSFGTNGLLTHELSDTWCYPDEMIVHNDQIILGGIYINHDFERYATLSRYDLDGNLDSGFGNVGYSSYHVEGDAAITGCSNIGMSLAPNGKILLTCNIIPGWLESDFALLRFNADGGIDNSFGANGIVVHAMDGDTYAHDVIVQANGKIIACGSYRNPDYDHSDFLVMRLLESGFYDPDFGLGGTGVVVSNISPEDWYSNGSNCAIFCNMDRLLVSGYANTDHSDPDFAMACYHTGLNVGFDENVEAENILAVNPNPFKHETTLTFDLSKQSDVSIEAYDVQGRLMDIIEDRSFEQGEHQLRWNSEGLPDGIYILRMKVNERVYITKTIKSN